MQQKGDMDEYTYEWEALATRVPELKDSQNLRTYVYILKPYIIDELKLLNVSTLDKARRKAKIIEENFKKTWNRNPNKDQKFVQRVKPETKYCPPHLRSDNKTSLESQ